MGSPADVIPGWEAINERLDSTLVQLNRLIHHYADVPLPGDMDGTDPGRDPGCVSEECLEMDIQEILRQAHVRLREFAESIGFKHGLSDQHGRQFQGANEELERSLADVERQNSFLKDKLDQARHDLANLNQKITQYEDTIDQYREEGVPNLKQARELEKTKAELIEKAIDLADTLALKEKTEKELAECKQSKKQELVKEKMQKQRELRELKENSQKEVLTTTQQHLDREIELQEFCQKERNAHTKTIEDMLMLHTKEIKKLKAEHAIKLEECCQNHASLETEWQDKELELHKKISVAVQERTRYIRLLFDEHIKVQDLEVQLAGVHSDLSNEKLAKSQLENEIKFMKVDVSLANEKVEMGLKAQGHTKSMLARVQEEMMDMKHTSAADFAKLEEKAFTLQKSLSCVTNTCVQSEHELHTQSKKIEELQRNMNAKQKELIGVTSELQKVHQEVQCLQSDIKAKDEEKKALQRNYETKCQQLQTKIFKLQMEEKQKCEDIIHTIKDNMECQLQRQAQQHQKYVQKLQEQFRMQWEECSKNTSFNSRWGMEGVCKS